MSWMLLLKLIWFIHSWIKSDLAKIDAELRKRFPPISDAEFLALCKPGTNPDIALRVRRLVAENFGIVYECVYPSANFAEDYGFC
jgi:hypothetical protein